jgi:hypothetical protein
MAERARPCRAWLGWRTREDPPDPLAHLRSGRAVQVRGGASTASGERGLAMPISSAFCARASDESEADAAACPLVVAQDEPREHAEHAACAWKVHAQLQQRLAGHSVCIST